MGNAGSKDQRVGGALPNLPGALSGSGESVFKCVCMTADTNLLLGGGDLSSGIVGCRKEAES